MTVFPNYMDVKVVGSPALHMVYSEVDLKGSENVQVCGPKQQECNFALAARPIDLQLTQWLSTVITEDVAEEIYQLCNGPFRRQD